MAITTVLMMKRVFNLSLRALQGFVDSIFRRTISDFKVLRLAKDPGQKITATLCDHARYLVGSQYSVAEAILVKGPEFTKQFRKNSRKQFCSRLVAQCFQKAGINLVSNANFCSPADLERCGLLVTVPDMVRPASE